MVAKVKTIEYCFLRAKPSKARRVASASLGSAKVTDYATMAELDEREEIPLQGEMSHSDKRVAPC